VMAAAHQGIWCRRAIYFDGCVLRESQVLAGKRIQKMGLLISPRLAAYDDRIIIWNLS
jgi:hypothetical protein